MIPTSSKDLAVVEATILSVRRNLRHPLLGITVVTPEENRDSLSRLERIQVLSDEEIVPPEILERAYELIGERAGWLIQQMIKLSAPDLFEDSHVYVIDADTVLVRPQSFLARSRTVLLCSFGYHEPYFDTMERLLPGMLKRPLHSCIAHKMLFTRDVLLELRNVVSPYGNSSWQKAILGAIDPSEHSSFSEYELYGHWLLNREPKLTIRRFNYNLALPRDDLRPLEELEKRYGRRYDSISFHSYIRRTGR